MISFRLLKNYEYIECASSTASSILELALDAGISINSKTLGQCISKIWKTKVKSVRRNLPKKLFYDNLALRVHDWEPITELNESSLAKITAACHKHHGWFVASSSFDDQRVMLMKEQTNEARVETRRLTFQITVELGSEEVLKFSTCGHELSLSHICTLLCDDSNVSCSAIDVLITFLERATPCLGQPVPEDTNEYHKVPVCDSRMTSVTLPGTGTHEEARLVSLSCTFLSYSRPNLITNVISCHECSKIHRLFRKREHQIEKNMASGSQVLHDFKLN